MVPSAGSVVLVPFPFSDLSHSKLRPALALSLEVSTVSQPNPTLEWLGCRLNANEVIDASQKLFISIKEAGSAFPRFAECRVESNSRGTLQQAKA